MLKEDEIEEVILRIKKVVGKKNPLADKLKKKGVDPFKLLVSILLSSRTKDETTEKVVEKVFKEFKTPDDFLKAETKKLEELLKPIGFFRVKAKNIKKLSEIVSKKYDGKIPCKFDELLKLPGVGRKTANLFLILNCNVDTICVDTHVHRISNKVGIVKTKTPLETELELKKKLKVKYWKDINRLFVLYGKTICKPVNPQCSKCVLNDICEYKKSVKI